MATSSYIYICLDDSDIGKEISYDSSKLTKPQYVVRYPPKTTIQKKYIGIYHHWDSYVHSLGSKLIECYNTKESILNLMSGGSASSILGSVAVQYYMTDLEERWDYNKPVFSDTEPELIEDFLYLFKDNNWYVKSKKFPDWIMVEQLLSDLT